MTYLLSRAISSPAKSFCDGLSRLLDVTAGEVVYGSTNLSYRGEYKVEGSCQKHEWQLQEWKMNVRFALTLEVGTNYAGKPRSAHIELAFDRGLVA